MRWLAIAVAFFALPAPAPGQSDAGPQRVIRVVMDDNYPPFVFHDAEGNSQGIVVDQWRLWERKTGIKVEIHAMDWGEALRRMRAGEFDVIDTIFRTGERMEFFEFTAPYARIEVPIFFRSGISGITDLASLKGFPVGAKTGDAAADQLAENGVAPVILFNNYEAIIHAARDRKVNVFMVDKPPALYFLHKLGIAEEFRATAPVNIGEFHRAVRKGDTALLREVERGFAEVGRTALDRVEEKWMGQSLLSRVHLREFVQAAAGASLLLILLMGWNWSLSRQVKKRTLALKESDARTRATLAEREQALARAEALLESAPDPIVIVNGAGQIERVNQQAEQTFGYPRRELLGTPADRLIPGFANVARGPFRVGRQDDPRVRPMGAGQERVARRKDGTEFPADISLSPLDTPDGTLTISTIRDITERQQAERRIRRLNRTYAVLSGINETIVREKNAPALLSAACRIAVEKGRLRMAWIGLVDPASGRLVVTASAGGNDEVLQMVNSLLDPTRPDLRCGITFGVLETGESGICNDIAQDPRSVLWREGALAQGFHAMASLPLKAGEKLIGTFNIYGSEPGFFDAEEVRLLNELAADISFALAVHESEVERRRIEERMRRLIESNLQGVIFWNKDGAITEANDAFLKITGYTRADLSAGRVNWRKMTLPEYAQHDERALEELAAKGVCAPHEKQYVRKDGSPVSVLVGAATFRDNPDAGVSFVLDLTERKELEQQFLRVQRLESIGTLAGGIAHDLNNVLSPIMMALGVLRLRFPDPDTRELLDVLRSSADHGAEMVRQILSFARGVEGRRMEVQVKHLVADLERLTRDTFPKDIRLETDVPHNLWTVRGDPTQLHQVLLNLSLNARDAMPRGGTLSITAENLQIDAHYAATSWNGEAQPGPYVFLRVEDTGMGIAPQILNKIFDPFFTTKEVGKGTGLGLSTTLAIIKSHGGFIRVESKPGRGTQFQLYLPALTGPLQAMAEGVPVDMLRGHGELVLVVDDEAGVRQITRQTLEAFGYRVLLASDGTEAVDAYARQREEIAVVLTDMTMPVMDGLATIQVLRKMNPDVLIIGASGRAAAGPAADAIGHAVRCFLPKPYTAETLLQTLRQVLPASEKNGSKVEAGSAAIGR